MLIKSLHCYLILNNRCFLLLEHAVSLLSIFKSTRIAIAYVSVLPLKSFQRSSSITKYRAVLSSRVIFLFSATVCLAYSPFSFWTFRERDSSDVPRDSCIHFPTRRNASSNTSTLSQHLRCREARWNSTETIVTEKLRRENNDEEKEEGKGGRACARTANSVL